MNGVDRSAAHLLHPVASRSYQAGGVPREQGSVRDQGIGRPRVRGDAEEARRGPGVVQMPVLQRVPHWAWTVNRSQA